MCLAENIGYVSSSKNLLAQWYSITYAGLITLTKVSPDNHRHDLRQLAIY